MTEPYIDEYDETDEPDPLPQQTQSRNDQGLRELRQKAKKYDSLLEENQNLKRNLAFTGLALPENPMSQLFRDKYDGDLTPEAVKAAAMKYGLIEAEQDPLADELQAQQRMADAANGAQPRPSQMTPEDVQEWPADRLMRFAKKYPDQWEALKRGEPVTGVHDF
jgi:hypothetical protein